MHLTRRGYFLAIGICALGIFGQWWGGTSQWLWLYLGVILLLALLLEWRVARRAALETQRLCPQQAHLGRRLKAALQFHNATGRSLSSMSEDDYPAGLSGERHTLYWDLATDQRLQQHYAVMPQQLGRVDWRDLYARTLGHWGLAWWSRRLSASGKLQVIPDRLHANEAKAGTREQGEMQQATVGAGFELLGLREYATGDPLHSIDWKATARSGQPKVRVFTQEQHLELVIAIDAGRHSAQQAGVLTRLNHYINIAARLAEKAVHNGDQVALALYADQPLETMTGIKSLADMSRLRNLLQQLQPRAVESNPLAAMLNIRNRIRQRSMVVLLTDLDEGDGGGQISKAVSLLMPKHLPLIASILDEEILELEQRPARHWLDPYHTLAAMESSIATRRLGLRLQRLGGHVVLARPGHMDAAVLRHYDLLRRRKRV